MQEIDRILKKHNLRRTVARTEVLSILLSRNHALSGNDIVNELPDADRITIYRTLKTFEDRGLIHQAVDGTQKIKYALCASECDVHNHYDSHAHFHCEICGNTTCVDEVTVQQSSIPEGMVVQHTTIVLKGQCGNCVT